MRALFLCICISAAISGVSQPIVQLEYFIDADPGFGMATQVPITTDTVIDVSFSIDLSALAVGAHTLYVRAKDSLDNWSFIQKQAFLYQPSIANPDIAMVEYYVDTDPGLGSASQFTFAPDENVTISQALDLSPLIPGSHTLYVRAKDENGSWSFQQKQAFLHHPRIPNPDITRIEFYIDSDPGLGMADTIPIALSTNVVADTTIDLSPLIVGSHALYARAQDENGDWSFPQKQAFLFDDQKVEFVEFKFDSLPGFGDWVVSNPFTPDFDITADIDFSGVCDLVTGWYYIDARARRQLSWWSKEYRDSIEIKDFYLQTGAVVDQFGDSVELVDLDVQGVGMFVTDAMGTYSFLVPKCWGDTVTLFRDSAYTATNSYVFQNPLLDYSPHHILGDIDSSLYAYKCVNQSGTIPADLDYVCEGANYVVNKAGETIDTGSISGYILHDGLLTLGTIYESNLDGAFLNDGTLPQNQKLYISPVVGRPGQMSLFDADHECTDIMLPGRPVVFLNTEDTVTLVLDSMGMASLNPAAMVTGGCSGCEIMSYGMSQANFGCIDHGINSEFLTVSDGSGNSAVCEVIVVVQDTIVPSFMCAGNATRSTDIDVCTYTVVGTEFDPTDVFDNCPVTLSNDKNGSASLAGAVFDLGTTIITWTVDDQHGNTSTCTLSVTVEDNQAPQIVCANAVRSTDTGQCTYTIAGSELDALPSDNCTDFTFVNDSTGTNTLAGMTLSIGVHVITWTVDDQHGQTATCSMTITVEDNESPVITCAANATRDTDSGVCTYTVSGSEFDPITVSDNCTDLTYTNDLTGTTTLAGEVLSRGVHVITWTVDDQHGQTATCAMTITVEDNEVPAITCPSSGVRAAEPGLCNYTVTGTEFDPIAVSDNCPDYVFANTYDTTGTLAGTVLPLGVHNITWVVNDLHGQFGLCDITITVEDTQPPSITCPADVTLAITAADCDTSYVYVAATSDNCSGEVVDVLSGVGSGGAFAAGVNTEILRVTDVGGNTATCAFSVTVESVPDMVADTICFGDSILLGGVFQYLPGMYIDTFMNSLGCDSVVITDLDTTTLCYWPSAIVYVDSAAAGANTGVDWPNAYVDLQLGLDVASRYLNITQIWVAEGTYYPTAAADRAISFVLVDSVEIFGGFQGFEADTSGRDPTLHPTRLSGNIGVANDSTDNSYRVVVSPNDVTGTTLDGFVIRDGVANGALPEQQQGAGLFNEGIVTLVNTVLTQCAATGTGRYILNQGASAELILRNCSLPQTVSQAVLNSSGAVLKLKGVNVIEQ